jgi:asparagine synthase (glutamine-hydrolysing)
MESLQVTGWIELGGRLLTVQEIGQIILADPGSMGRFGGEFFLSWDGCCARDHFGVMQGNCRKGTITCNGTVKGSVIPDPADMPLEEAIVTAVRLRSGEGVTALSGGVDSSLVAKLAGRECVAVGLRDSHDLRHAKYAAGLLGLSCTYVEITQPEIEAALPVVVAIIPKKDPVSTGIALTQYFIARWTGEHGHRRVITGQGADELFGGYQRYQRTATLADDLARDIAGLEEQATRDQSVAALHGAYLSMPYLDMRVVRAALAIPAREKVHAGIHKIPLRTVAERYIPAELAWYGKKAMQYGSGIWKVLQKLARKNGYKTSMQDYIDHISRVNHGH